MNLDLFFLSEYGVFVWPAFIFTFLCCFVLYLKTYKEFKKQENLYFASFKEQKSYKIKTSKPQEIFSSNTAI